MEWIPIEERLPEKPGEYLVTLENGNVRFGVYHPSPIDRPGCPWLNGAKTAVAWMPVPEPYKEE